MNPHCPPAIRLLIPALFGVALLTSCETMDEDKYQGITVSPTYTKLWLNGSVTLTASGGFNYRWSVEDPSYGSLSSSTGNSVTYTVRKLASTGAFVQTITVTGSVANYASATGTTNAALYTAEAQVSHGSTAENVAISPDGGSATVGGSPITLTASGGDGTSYSWKIADGTIGTLSTSKGRQVTYRATNTANATQTVTISSGGRSYQIAIIHVL